MSYASISLIFFWVLCSPLSAKRFPVLSNQNTQLIYIEDGELESALKRVLIEGAKYSIDVVNYIHVPDAYGMNEIQALRSKADQGIPIRFIYEAIPSWFQGDYLQGTRRLLEDPKLGLPAQVLSLSVLDKMKLGVSKTGGVHDKILMVDRGTANEKILIGGRYASRFGMRKMDSGYILIPKDFKLPHVGQHVAVHYDELWSEIHKRLKTHQSKEPGPSMRERAQHFVSNLKLSPAQKVQFTAIQKFLDKGEQGAAISGILFSPRSMEFVTNDVLVNTLQGKMNKESDPASIPSDIIDRVAEQMSQSQRVDMTAYALIPPRQLKGAIEKLLGRGGEFSFYTNGRNAHRLFWPGGVGVYNTLGEWSKLYISPFASRPELYLFEPEGRESPSNGLPFIHRKQILFDDSLTITGSDNFTRSAHQHLSENVLVIEDSALVARLKVDTAREMGHTLPTTPEEARRLFESRPLYAPCFKLLGEKLM